MQHNNIAQLTPEVVEVRAQLLLTLATLVCGPAVQRQDQDIFDQCSRLGMWPVPRGRESCLADIAWVGPRLLALFTDCQPELRAWFERWHAISRRDSVSAAHWLMRMDLWQVPTQT